MVARKPGHQGERVISRKTIVQGMPGRFRRTCGDYRVLTTFCTRAAGATSTRHSLRPLSWRVACALIVEGQRSGKTRALRVAGKRNRIYRHSGIYNHCVAAHDRKSPQGIWIPRCAIAHQGSRKSAPRNDGSRARFSPRATVARMSKAICGTVFPDVASPIRATGRYLLFEY